MKLISSILAACALLIAAGCGTLDKSGVYKGDQGLYASDITLKTTYTAFDMFLKWELANREALKSKPEVTKYADYIRDQAPKWYASAMALRSAYLANPTPENKASLENILNIMNAALNEAGKYLAQPIK